MTRGSVPRVNDNMHAGEYVCFDKAVIIRPQAPPPGRQTQKGSALRWGPQLLSQLPHPNGTSPRLGEHMPPAGGNQKNGAAENCTPHKTSFPGGNANTLQPSYKPYRHTNRHTNRARRRGNSYKPHKPYTKGAYFPTPQIVTVCTVCTNSLSAVHGLYDGLYDVLYGL